MTAGAYLRNGLSGNGVGHINNVNLYVKVG